MDFAILADYWVKLRESENSDKYLDFARELKKLWNMKVAVIPIVIGAFSTRLGNKRMSGDHPSYEEES